MLLQREYSFSIVITNISQQKEGPLTFSCEIVKFVVMFTVYGL